MAKLFLEYIHQQPEILRAIAEDESIAKPFLNYCGKEPRRIFLLGSGSSYNAACACADPVRELLAVETTCLTPTQLEGLTRLEDGIYIALSQSGTSTSTLAAVKQLQGSGKQVLAMTAAPQSPVAIQADGHITVPCGEEAIGPKTKGATATMMTLLKCALSLAAHWGSAPQAVLQGAQAQLAAAPALVSKAVESGTEFYQKNRESLVWAGNLMLVADAHGYQASLECALKLLETCWLPVFPYEFEEFMHGIHYTVGKDSQLVFLLPQDGDERARMLRLAAFASDNGARCYLLDTGSGKGAGHFVAKAGPINRAFALIAFFQAVCAPFSMDRGIDCDVPRYADFGKFMETKKLSDS